MHGSTQIVGELSGLEFRIAYIPYPSACETIPWAPCRPSGTSRLRSQSRGEEEDTTQTSSVESTPPTDEWTVEFADMAVAGPAYEQKPIAYVILASTGLPDGRW